MRNEALYKETKEKIYGLCRKRSVAKKEFSEETMNEVKVIDSFFRQICLGELTKAEAEDSDEYFCLVAKVKANEQNTYYIHKTFKIKEFFYEKDEQYLAKCAWLLAQEEKVELYFCVASIGVGQNEYGFYSVDRRKSNTRNVRCLFTDLDLTDELKLLSDEELFDRFQEEYSEFIRLFDPVVVKSGHGLHVYVPTDDMRIYSEEDRNQYECYLEELVQFLLPYGSDFHCADAVRILRVPLSYNRKKEPIKVKILRNSESRQSMEYVVHYLDMENRGGMDALCQEVSDSIFLDEEEYTENREEDGAFEGFVKITVSEADDPFLDDNDFNVYIGSAKNNILALHTDTKQASEEKVLQIQQTGATEQKKQVQDTVKRKNRECKEREYHYEGISMDIRDLEPGEYWQVRDILWWACNRKQIKGVRHILFFFLMYCFYYKNGLREQEPLYVKCDYINKHYINPPLTEEELQREVKDNLKRFEGRSFHYGRGIRNSLIQKHLRFTEEEKEFTIGNYYDIGTAEYEEKIKKGKLERGRRNSKTYEAYAKKQQLYTDIFIDAPDITLEEAKEKYGMSNTAYYSYKEKAGIELKKDINQKKIDELFTSNPNIGYEEFHAETGLSRSSFTIYRNKYGFNDADREKKQKWEQVFKENPDITFKEAKKYGISNTSYYRYRKKYSKT